MPRRVVMLLLIISLVGCANPHAHRAAAELRPGNKPSTSEVKYEAVYALHRTDQSGAALHCTRLVRGEKVGFQRRSGDSIVAVAGAQSIPLPDGCYEWVLVKGSAPRWQERAAEDCRRAAAGVGSGVLFCGLIVAALAVVGVTLAA